MTVADLISHLGRFDPTLRVVVVNGRDPPKVGRVTVCESWISESGDVYGLRSSACRQGSDSERVVYVGWVDDEHEVTRSILEQQRAAGVPVLVE